MKVIVTINVMICVTVALSSCMSGWDNGQGLVAHAMAEVVAEQDAIDGGNDARTAEDIIRERDLVDEPSTSEPSLAPTHAQTPKPTTSPTTAKPTASPKKSTATPTRHPTKGPMTSTPTLSPTKKPTGSPTTQAPTRSPSHKPTARPTSVCDSINDIQVVKKRRKTCNSIDNKLECAWDNKAKLCKGRTLSPTKMPTNRQPNILMIVSDDMKTMIKDWGSPYAKTPNLDRISKMGISFMNAHAAMAICGPSRASFLTSRRPDSLQIWNIGVANILHNRRVNTQRLQKKNLLTIPAFLKLNGYRTYGMGKIYHGNEWAEMIDPNSWTDPVYTYHSDRTSPFYPRPPSISRPFQGSWIGWSRAGDPAFPDGQLGDLAVDLLKGIVHDQSSPWFLAVGFFSPHLPWHAPLDDFDAFSVNQFVGAHHPAVPQYMTQKQFQFVKGNGCGEVLLYSGAPSGGLTGQSPLADQKSAIRAYHATIRYMDRQIGKILDFLQTSEDANNTHIIMFSDHGYHLGEHNLYCKHTNFEQATRVPFVIAPALEFTGFPRGSKSSAPVELLDLLPTIADLVGLEQVTDKNSKYVAWEGMSLMPVMMNPANATIKQAAVSQYFRKNVWGYSLRTVQSRMTVWLNKNLFNGKPPLRTGTLEMYDYINDKYELKNLAYSPVQEDKTLFDQFAKGYKVWQKVGTTSQKFSTLRGGEPHDKNRMARAITEFLNVEYP